MERTRENILAFRHLIESAAALQDDANALESVWMYPAWEAGTDYAVGDRIRHNGALYRCEQAHTSQDGWEPDPAATRALWTPVSVEEWPEWIQPTGAQDAYHVGDKVTYADKRWISTADNNIWAPGVYGWTEAAG